MTGISICDDERELEPHEEVLLAYNRAPDRLRTVRQSPVTGVFFNVAKSICKQLAADIRAIIIKRDVYNELAGYGSLPLSETDRVRAAATSVEGCVFAVYSANLAANGWAFCRPPFAAFAAAYIRSPSFGFLLAQDPGLLLRYPDVPFDLAEFPGWKFSSPLAMINCHKL
jgi:hypothetical protein